MRKAPSWSSPSGERCADREALTQVVQSDADRDEERERQPRGSRAAGQATGERGHAEEAQGDAEEHEPCAPERRRERRLEVERLGERLDAEEREQPGGERHERREPHRARMSQRREPEQSERDGENTDDEPDERVAEESLRRRLRRRHRRRDLLHGLDPGRVRHPDRDRVVLDPLEGDDDRARAKASERRRSVDVVGNDRVVDVHVRDREVVTLRVPYDDADLARRELDATDVELVRGRRVRADEVDERRAGGDDHPHRGGEQQHRDDRPDAPVDPAAIRRRRVRLH